MVPCFTNSLRPPASAESGSSPSAHSESVGESAHKESQALVSLAARRRARLASSQVLARKQTTRHNRLEDGVHRASLSERARSLLSDRLRERIHEQAKSDWRAEQAEIVGQRRADHVGPSLPSFPHPSFISLARSLACLLSVCVHIRDVRQV